MGGAAEGAFASKEAVRIIRDKIVAHYYDGMSDISVKGLMISALENANRIIYDLSLSDKKYYGMGTTVVAVIATDEYMYYAHAGDSRVYKISPDEAQQLTNDHSVVQRMVENGEITATEALDHPSKHIITRALGADSEIRIDFGQEPFEDDDLILLCSDGLSNYLETSALAQFANENKDCEKLCRALVEHANSAGGQDNITAVVAKLK
jgi:protein phosphatase